MPQTLFETFREADVTPTIYLLWGFDAYEDQVLLSVWESLTAAMAERRRFGRTYRDYRVESWELRR